MNAVNVHPWATDMQIRVWYPIVCNLRSIASTAFYTTDKIHYFFNSGVGQLYSFYIVLLNITFASDFICMLILLIFLRNITFICVLYIIMPSSVYRCVFIDLCNENQGLAIFRWCCCLFYKIPTIYFLFILLLDHRWTLIYVVGFLLR